jgi:DNA polymerase
MSELHTNNRRKQWRIYCASASAIFGAPVEKHGQNSHLRQKGKIAELALGYGGPVGALKSFGGESVTYEGVGGTKKWERIESYGPKFVENIVQAISRDILCYAMRTLSHCLICAHVHDELIIECREDISLEAICEQMGRTPPWAEGLVLRADGYCTKFYKKD